MAKLTIGLTAAAAVIGLASTALAQTNPNASEIIKALQPTGTISNTTRGIRPAGAPLPAPSPATPAAMPATAPAATAPAPAMPASMPAMAPATTAPAPAATPVTATAKAPSVNLSVQFATGSAALTPEATATLDQLGSALTSAELKDYRFRIAGHTDTVGTPAYNLTLSQERANAVASYLESKFAIPASRLDAIGRGENGLLVPTPPQTPEARNRRVQVTNLGG